MPRTATRTRPSGKSGRDARRGQDGGGPRGDGRHARVRRARRLVVHSVVHHHQVVATGVARGLSREQVLRVLGERRGRGIAVVRVLGQRAREHALDVGGQPGDEARERLGVLVDDAVHDAGDRRGEERRPAREQGVGHGCEREDVGAAVHVLDASLLGGRVERGPDELAGRREAHARALQAGDPEVRDLGLARRQHDHVGRLDVAVNDAVAVSVVEGARDLGDGAHHDRPGHGALAREVGERLAAQQLEGDEERSRGRVASHVVHDDDAGVVERRGDAGLLQEAFLVGLQLARLGGRLDHLEGHGAVEDGVAGLVDDAHRPAPDLALDLVPPDRGWRAQTNPSPLDSGTGRRGRPRGAHQGCGVCGRPTRRFCRTSISWSARRTTASVSGRGPSSSAVSRYW